jgi:broad specificity phosphatase PhoE
VGRVLLLALTTLACAHWTASADETQPQFALYLIRHAEKTEHAEDPGLTKAGRRRAQRMAGWLADKHITAIWSSDYLRSRATAQPLADRLGIPVRLYDPQQLDAFSAELLHGAETALVVGHSNTTPELASLLCGCPVTAMADSDYERFFRVTVSGPGRHLREYDQRRLAGPPGRP